MIRASQIHQSRLCPGSVAAQEGIPEESSQAVAVEGQAIHEAHHDPTKAASLNPKQIKVLQEQVTSRETILGQLLKGCDAASVIVVKEDEMMIRDQTGEVIISGHPDYVAIGKVNGKRIAVIPDYKTGWLDVPAPEVNDQLRAYAVMIADLYNVSEVYCMIIPRNGKTLAPVIYSRADLDLARTDLQGVEAATRLPNAPRRPSLDACRYCRARATTRCPETLREMDIMVSHNVLPTQLLPADIALWIEKAQASIASAKKFLERVEKLITEYPDAVRGYAMVPGAKRRVIEDATAAFNAIRHLLDPDKDAEEFSAIVKVGIGDIQGLVVSKLREADPTLKVKDAEKQADDLLSDVVVWKQNKPSLTAVNQLKEAA